MIDKLRVLNDSLAEHMEADNSSWDKLIEDVKNVKVCGLVISNNML